MKKTFLIIMLLNLSNLYSQNCINYCLTFDDSICINHLKIDKINYPGNIWQIASPQKPLFNTPLWVNTPKAIITDSLQSYPVNNLSVFTIWNLVSMGDYYGLKRFSGNYNIQSDSSKDYGSIEFSTDKGLNWLNLVKDTTYSANFMWIKKPVLTGNSNGWKFFDLIISDLGSLFNIQIGDTVLYRFSFKSDSIQNNKGGLMYDNICFNDFVEGVTETRFKNIHSIIYPNPVKDIFTIEFENPDHENFELAVYDLQSKLQYSLDNITDNKININAALFKSGSYYYKITNLKAKKRCWGKIVIGD